MLMFGGRRGWPVIAAVFMLLAVAGFATVFAQSATVVRVEDTEIDADSTGDVVIALEDVTEIVAMHIEITYDPALLEWQEYEQGDLLAGNALVEANTENPGRVILGFATLDAVESEGELVIASFESTGEEGSTTIGLENVQAWDSDGFDVLIDAQNGQITIESGFPDWLLILILAAICLLLLIIAIVIFIWFRRRRRSAPVQQEVAQPVPPPAAPPAEQQPQTRATEATESDGPKFCSNCGHSLRPGVAYCPNCGAQVQND